MDNFFKSLKFWLILLILLTSAVFASISLRGVRTAKTAKVNVACSEEYDFQTNNEECRDSFVCILHK